MSLRPLVCVSALVASAALAAPAMATFHFMQIEQIIGGVNGDPTKQAIQLRMRFASQGFTTGVQLKVYNAAGQNPITLLTCPSGVPVANLGSRILIASPNFLAATSPTCVPNFTMTALIPPSYLAAGRLTWESGGTIYWSVSWGGAAYTGPQTGSVTNDANGNFGPAFAQPLPSTTLQALRFPGGAGAASTTNAADYTITAGAAVFVNNAGASFTVIAPPPPPCPADFNGDGTVDPDDLSDFIAAFFNVPPDPRANFNGDSAIDPDDLADYIAAFFGPAC